MERQDRVRMAAALPEDMLAEVLRRVAAPCWLAVCRCVSKAWRATIDARSLLPADLPLPFSGIFIDFAVLPFPEFFTRPSSPSPGKPAAATISGKLDFLPSYTKVDPKARGHGNIDHIICDHCNGLLLLSAYVANPATRSWDPLPPHPPDPTWGVGSFVDAYLAFDPTMSRHYQVFRIPHFYSSFGMSADEVHDPFEEASSEWPPSPCILQVFSSRTGRWEERSFVREGNTTARVANVRGGFIRCLSVHWRGSLYMHRRNNFVMRISLSEDKYRVIKPPIDLGTLPYLGRSEKGVYFASFVKGDIRVWILKETCDHAEWMLKGEYDLKPVRAFDRHVHGPWILEDINYGFFNSNNREVNNKEEIVQDKFEWDSGDDDDDDDDDHGGNDDENGVVKVCNPYPRYIDIEILGFHPYKEILFLGRSESYKENAMGLAYHLNTSKVESLGSIYPRDYAHFDYGLVDDGREVESFPYTPCRWIEEFPGNSE